jgi:hypothetical protein
MQAGAFRVRFDEAHGTPRTMRIAFFVALVLGFAACAFADEQVGISAAGNCIRANCRDPNASDYTRCEAACRATYAK